jgi:hypothetical protein
MDFWAPGPSSTQPALLGATYPTDLHQLRPQLWNPFCLHPSRRRSLGFSSAPMPCGIWGQLGEFNSSLSGCQGYVWPLLRVFLPHRPREIFKALMSSLPMASSLCLFEPKLSEAKSGYTKPRLGLLSPQTFHNPLGWEEWSFPFHYLATISSFNVIIISCKHS